VFFENTRCLACDSVLRFDAWVLELIVAGPRSAGLDCADRELAACNWRADAAGALCRSCQLTRTRPNDADAVGLAAFAVAERAKRRALVQLIELGIPDLEPGQLAFDMLSSEHEPVSIGHADGVVTIDLAESDDARREARRNELGEPYRTMLGHLRHELGHFAQPRPVAGEQGWARCRQLFGDEREDYAQTQARHYAEGPPPGWQERVVSAYAIDAPRGGLG